ncbi:Deoxyhypusine hydroxylase [Galdieria sulphuraria]|nr:Deoxyhypusine hydroxylase [Galdieria sulphuraria]
MISASLEELEFRLLNVNNNVAVRIRSIFGFKGLGGHKAVEVLSRCLLQDPSCLVRHEAAYALGQMREVEGLNVLYRCLLDESEDPMVRHEAAEAIGAIGKKSSVGILQKALVDSSREVRETCELAIKRILSTQHLEENDKLSSVGTLDPVPSSNLLSQMSTIEIGERFLDPSLTLFERYGCLFELRERASPDAVSYLCKGFNDDSALLKHEIAFVLGQLSNAQATESLMRIVSNPDEHYMVRHEAAEALGSMATEEVVKFLRQYLSDENIVDFHYTDVLIPST